MNDKKYILFLLVKIITNISGAALILFLSAGTVFYTEGWFFIGAICVAAVAYSGFMFIKYPELFKKRLLYKEHNTVQQLAIVLFLLVVVGMLVSAGLTFRLGLYVLPRFRFAVCAVLSVLAAILYLNVIRYNEYLTSEITVRASQAVVANGPYAVVRHPMYAAMLLFVLAGNLYFGGVLSLISVMLFIPVLMLRILNEEKILCRDLCGYAEYKNKVRYRLIPFIW